MIPASNAGTARQKRLMTRLKFTGEIISFCAAIVGSFAILAHNLPVIILGHFLAAIAGGCAGAVADSRRLGIPFFPWIMAFTMPLWGGIMTCLLLEAMKKHRTGTLGEEYAVYLNDAASYKVSVPVPERPVSAEFVSLKDVLLNSKSDTERRVAIEYLSEMETQAAFEILRNTAVFLDRKTAIFATNVMAQEKDKLLADINELENSVRDTGKDHVNVELLKKTAVAYIDFCYYQFATDENRIQYLHRAETLLRLLVDAPRSTADEALILLGRVKLAQNDGEDAVTCFNRYIERNPCCNLGYLWRAEAWHTLGKYTHLREDCRAARKIGSIPPNMMRVLDFWLPEEPGEDRETWIRPELHTQLAVGQRGGA